MKDFTQEQQDRVRMYPIFNPRLMVHGAANRIKHKIITDGFTSYDKTLGLCTHLKVELSEHDLENRVNAQAFLGHLITQWPKHSGYAEFPIPSQTEGRTHCDEYFMNPNKYDTTTDYGRLRMELLDFIIEQTKQ